MTLEEILAELNKLDRTIVVTELQKLSQPIFQAVFDKGHSAATARFTDDKANLDSQIAGLKQQIAQKDTEIRTLTDKTPDVAAVRTQLEGQIQVLQRKMDEALKTKDAEIIAERVSRMSTDLRTKLVGLGTDSDYAQVLVDKAETRARFRPDEKSGKVDVLQADGGIPIQAAAGQDVLDVLAAELVQKVPTKFVTVNSDRGSNTKDGAPGPGGGNMYDNIRKEAAAKKEAATKSPSLKERMGMSTSA